jgi:hypothetical protein
MTPGARLLLNTRARVDARWALPGEELLLGLLALIEQSSENQAEASSKRQA